MSTEATDDKPLVDGVPTVETDAGSANRSASSAESPGDEDALDPTNHSALPNLKVDEGEAEASL